MFTGVRRRTARTVGDENSQPDGRPRPKSQASCTQTFMGLRESFTNRLAVLLSRGIVGPCTNAPPEWQEPHGRPRPRSQRCVRNYRSASTHRPKGWRGNSQPDGRQRPKPAASCTHASLIEPEQQQTHRPRGWRASSPNQTAGPDRSRSVALCLPVCADAPPERLERETLNQTAGSGRSLPRLALMPH